MIDKEVKDFLYLLILEKGILEYKFNDIWHIDNWNKVFNANWRQNVLLDYEPTYNIKPEILAELGITDDY